jgi:hypothetical protein
VNESKYPVTGVAKPSFKSPRWSSVTLVPLAPWPACQLTTWIVSLRVRKATWPSLALCLTTSLTGPGFPTLKRNS